MTTETDTEQTEILAAEALIPEPETRKPVHRFKPGESGNPLGRPRKGETYQDLLRAERNKRAAKLAKHAVDMALTERTPRFNTYISDRLDGIPKQTLLIQREEDPALGLLAELIAQRQIEGTTKLLPSGESQT